MLQLKIKSKFRLVFQGKFVTSDRYYSENAKKKRSAAHEQDSVAKGEGLSLLLLQSTCMRNCIKRTLEHSLVLGV